MIHKAIAPEKMRMKVKLAASMPVSRNAARQRIELLANAIIASSVRMKTRAVTIGDYSDSNFGFLEETFV